ncbi:MAG: hypothetical protein KBT39_01535 [Bacteroidales bacterium]|nr:hypothetical protein [Bacteroidales bacterium]
MKKFVIALAAVLFAGSMFAQTPEEKKAAKEAEKAAKAAEKAANKAAMDLYDKGYSFYDKSNTKMNEFNQNKQYEKDQAKVAAMQAKLNAEMYDLAKQGSPILGEALATGRIEEKKLFEGYHAQDFMLSQLINAELQHASKKEPFDTAFFAKAAMDMCDACHYQLKYGKTNDDQQKVIISQVKAKFPRLYTYLAYAVQFEIENKNLEGACKALDSYKNFPQKYPEIANEPSVANPEIPFSQFAFNIYYTAYQAKRFDICEKYFDEAIQFDDESSKAFVTQSRPQMYLQKGDTIAWTAAMKELIDNDPESETAEIAAQNLLAYYAGKSVDDMGKFADELIAKNPNSKIANYGKGFSFVARQKFAEAAKYYEKCVEIDPDYFDGNYQCGFCYYQIGLENGRKISDKKYASQAAADKEAETLVKSYLRKALPYFEKARELKPDDPSRWAFELKTIYNNLGMKDKAKSLPSAE